MTTWSAPYPAHDREHRSWLGRAESWLDDRGRWAWIATTVVGFMVFWPIGLAVLAYAIWSKRMFSKSCGWSRHDVHDRRHRMHSHGRAMRSSGNTAFDAYKTDTIDRLVREQDEFEAFLTRLRQSKDKAEFDAYLDERAHAAREADATPQPPKPETYGRDDDRMAGPGRY